MIGLILVFAAAGMSTGSITADARTQNYAPSQSYSLAGKELSASKRRDRAQRRERRAERREQRTERRERRVERRERREDRGSDSYNSNQRETSRSNRSARSEERSYRREDSHDSSRRDSRPSSGARERRAERQVERNPYRSSGRPESSRRDRRSSDYTMRERRPSRGSDDPPTYVLHGRQSARTADSDERNARNRNDTNSSSRSDTSSAAQRFQSGNAARSQPRQVAPPAVSFRDLPRPDTRTANSTPQRNCSRGGSLAGSAARDVGSGVALREARTRAQRVGRIAVAGAIAVGKKVVGGVGVAYDLLRPETAYAPTRDSPPPRSGC